MNWYRLGYPLPDPTSLRESGSGTIVEFSLTSDRAKTQPGPAHSQKGPKTHLLNFGELDIHFRTRLPLEKVDLVPLGNFSSPQIVQ